jgi:hypothetical protein
LWDLASATNPPCETEKARKRKRKKAKEEERVKRKARRVSKKEREEEKRQEKRERDLVRVFFIVRYFFFISRVGQFHCGPQRVHPAVQLLLRARSQAQGLVRLVGRVREGEGQRVFLTEGGIANVAEFELFVGEGVIGGKLALTRTAGRTQHITAEIATMLRKGRRREEVR